MWRNSGDRVTGDDVNSRLHSRISAALVVFR